MRREEGLARLLVVSLVSLEHSVEPREELLGAVVRVEDDWHAVEGSDVANVVGGSDGAGDGGLLLVVGETLAGKVGGTTLGDLEDDGALGVAGSLESGVGRRRRAERVRGVGRMVRGSTV